MTDSLLKPELPPEVSTEMGSSLLPYSSWSSYDGAFEVRNRPVVSIEDLTQMTRRDGQARAITQLLTLPLRFALQNGKWEAPIGDDDAQEEVDYANAIWTQSSLMGGMTNPVNKFISQMLLSVPDGYAPFEICYRKPQKFGDPRLDKKVTIQKLAYRDPKSVHILTDAKGGFNGFRQTSSTPMGIVDVKIPIVKSLVFTVQGERNPFYGISFLESAYPHFDAKRKLYYIAHLAAQFAAVPGRIGTVPPEATRQEIEEFKRALADFAFNTAMVMRQNFKVDEFKPSANFDFIKLIEHHNTMMAKSVLAQFFSDDQRTVLIENTKQDASADLFLLCMETVASDLAESLSAFLMPQLINWNFGTGKYPRFVPGKISDAARDIIFDMFKTFASASVMNATPEFIRELEKKSADALHLDIDYDHIAEMEKQAAEMEMQAQQEQAATQAEALKQQQAQASNGAPPSASDAQASDPKKAPPAATAPTKLSSSIDDLVRASQELFGVGQDLVEDEEVE